MIAISTVINYLKQQLLVAYRSDTNHDLVEALGAANQITLDKLKTLDERATYLTTVTFETIWIQHFLNDLLDPVLRRITIETNEGQEQIWHFQRAEERNTGHMYRRWVAATAYSIGDWVIYLGKVYEAMAATTGDVPADTPSKWGVGVAAEKIFQRVEYWAEYSFTVWLPDTYDAGTVYNIGDTMIHDHALRVCRENGVTGAYNDTKWSNNNKYIRKELSRYIAAGHNYNIQTIV